MSIEEARKSYGAVVAKLKAAENDYQNLVKKLDDVESETASLNAKVTTCEDEEKSTYDNYFLGKSTEKDLEAIRKKTQQAKDAISAHSKMLESLARCISTKEREIPALRKQVDSLRHQVWQSLFEQKVNTIPETVREVVRELVVIGLNCSMGRDCILPKIFSMPTSGEIQEIYQELATSLGIE